ncbi:unnamed protein product, partial [Mycena citricolor]
GQQLFPRHDKPVRATAGPAPPSSAPGRPSNRRRRSPEPALHSGDREPDSSHTKSPHTNRVVKKGKTGPDADPFTGDTHAPNSNTVNNAPPSRP